MIRTKTASQVIDAKTTGYRVVAGTTFDRVLSLPPLYGIISIKACVAHIIVDKSLAFEKQGLSGSQGTRVDINTVGHMIEICFTLKCHPNIAKKGILVVIGSVSDFRADDNTCILNIGIDIDCINILERISNSEIEALARTHCRNLQTVESPRFISSVDAVSSQFLRCLYPEEVISQSTYKDVTTQSSDNIIVSSATAYLIIPGAAIQPNIRTSSTINRIVARKTGVVHTTIYITAALDI